MRCPRCAVAVPAGELVCPMCGVQIDYVQAFQVLQEELGQAQVDASQLSTRLQDLHAYLSALAPWIDPNAQNAAPAPADSQTDGTEVPVAERPETAGEMASPAPDALPLSELAVPSGHTAGAEVRFGQQWLLVIGVAITVLGIGFFLKYAFDRNWVGPAGRIALAYLVALSFLGAGEGFRRWQAPMFGLYLIGGGIATLYLTTFAGFQLYDLFGQGVAFTIMVGITVGAGVLALRHDARWLAILGLIGGFLTPVILSAGQENQVVLMSYMALLNFGILPLAALRRWHVLHALGLALTWLLFAGWFVRAYTSDVFWLTLFFLHLFFLIYVLVPFLYYFVRERRERLTGLAIALCNTYIAFGFALAMIEQYASLRTVSSVTLAYAGLFLSLAVGLYRRYPAHQEAFIALLGQGGLFLIFTVPLLFAAHWITIFWSLQAVALLWMGRRLAQRWFGASALGLLFLSLGKFFLYDYAEIFGLNLSTLAYDPTFSTALPERWSTTLTVLAALGWSARLWRQPETAATSRLLPSTLFAAFATCLWLVLTLEVSAYTYMYMPQARFAALSVLWGLFSVALMLGGFRYQRTRMRLCALGLLTITVLKVFLADMARVSTPFRIVSFVMLGLMLIGASYLYHRYRDILLPQETSGGL